MKYTPNIPSIQWTEIVGGYSVSADGHEVGRLTRTDAGAWRGTWAGGVYLGSYGTVAEGKAVMNRALRAAVANFS